MAATVSVSWPIRTAFSRVVWRCRAGRSAGTGVCVIDDHAAWNAVTTNPFGVKTPGRSVSASSMISAHRSRRSGGRQIEADPDLRDLARLDGFADGDAPQHAGVDRQRVCMRQRRDGGGGLCDPVVVAQVGERYRAGSHQ